MRRPGWDYLMGVEGKHSLILPGAQINSKRGEEGHSSGCTWPAALTLTNSGSTLKSVCSTTPKSSAGSSLGRVRCVKVWPPRGDSANPDDGAGWALAVLDLTHLLSSWARLGLWAAGFKSWLCLTMGPRGGFQFPHL